LAHYLSCEETFDRAAGVAREAAFKTARLLGKDKDGTNTCGQSWGQSMDRTAHTPSSVLKERAVAFGRRPGQEQAPIAMIEASLIREIVSPDAPDGQLLQVLDDGEEGDPGHAVLRACDGVSRAGVTEARRQLLKKLRLIELTDPRFAEVP
jgi:hypothetical protein